MGLLIDWNDPDTPVRVQIWAILAQRPSEWREFIDYMWFRFRCRMQPGYENWVNMQEWEAGLAYGLERLHLTLES